MHSVIERQIPTERVGQREEYCGSKSHALYVNLRERSGIVVVILWYF